MNEPPVADFEVRLLLEDIKPLADEHWSKGVTLPYRPPNEDGARPCCILGLIGLARWGTEWDANVAGYTALQDDPVAAAAIAALGEAVDGDDPKLGLYEGDSAITKVYRQNDTYFDTPADVRRFVDRALR